MKCSFQLLLYPNSIVVGKPKQVIYLLQKKKEEKIFHSYLYVCLFVQKKLYYIN